MENSQILIRPIISEKSLSQTQQGWYTFAVALASKKPEIKKAVEEAFGVSVLAVKTMIFKGKTRKAGRRRVEVKHSSWKKALVKLGQGQTINLFEIPGGSERKNK